MHLDVDGSRLYPQPSDTTIRELVIKIAVEEKLVTPFTSAIGVILRRNPVNHKNVEKVEIPLKAPFGRALFSSISDPRKVVVVEESEEEEMGFSLFDDCDSKAGVRSSIMPCAKLNVCGLVENQSEREDKEEEDIVDILNRERTTKGYWRFDEELLCKLVTNPEKARSLVQESASFQNRDVLMTAVVLTFLRKYMGAEHARWEGMESKASKWLQRNGARCGRESLVASRLV